MINESGLCSLILSSKLEATKKFKQWVTSKVLPARRKYGEFKLFDYPKNNMMRTENETDLIIIIILKIFIHSLLKHPHRQTCEFTLRIIFYATIQYYYTVKIDLNKIK